MARRPSSAASQAATTIALVGGRLALAGPSLAHRGARSLTGGFGAQRLLGAADTDYDSRISRAEADEQLGASAQHFDRSCAAW